MEDTDTDGWCVRTPGGSECSIVALTSTTEDSMSVYRWDNQTSFCISYIYICGKIGLWYLLVLSLTSLACIGRGGD